MKREQIQAKGTAWLLSSRARTVGLEILIACVVFRERKRGREKEREAYYQQY